MLLKFPKSFSCLEIEEEKREDGISKTDGFFTFRALGEIQARLRILLEVSCSIIKKASEDEQLPPLKLFTKDES